MRTYKACTIAIIEWIDSQTVYGWSEYEASEDKPATILTAGLLVSDDKDSVTVAVGVSKSKKFTGKLTIPRCAIKYISKLTEVLDDKSK